ncbi:hypothetical protein LJB84_01115 [Bacteroidales bacterium OttesenSCG-928-J19]|nr:hypothetical protein [Bacteroidales bacterium OttesenSCG-928-J19]
MKTKLIIFISVLGLMRFSTVSAQLYEELETQETHIKQEITNIADRYLDESTITISSFQEEGIMQKAVRPDVGKNEGGSGNIPIGEGIAIVLVFSLFYLFYLTRRIKEAKS